MVTAPCVMRSRAYFNCRRVPLALPVHFEKVAELADALAEPVAPQFLAVAKH